jgi:phosphatidylserine/phosphatidylglycerophosphate/cardiolipin synthase-like enzyme
MRAVLSLVLVPALGALLLGWPSAAAADAFSLVYTQPLETDLAQPALASPTTVWCELFDKARTSIAIEQFYLALPEAPRPDAETAFTPVLRSLERAARRGVKVRVLVEGKMVSQSQPAIDLLRRWPNTEVRVLPFGRAYPGGIIHAKLLIVDRQLAYVGSHNFDWRSLSHTQELGVRIEDAQQAARLQDLFEFDWAAQASVASGQPVTPLRRDRPLPLREQAVYMVASPYAWLPDGIGDSESELVRLIGGAQRRLQIQLLNYVPLDHHRQFYPVIDNALRAAVARGVQVELLVSDWNADLPGLYWLKSLALLPGVQVRMVTLPEARSGHIPFARVVHAKYMVVDGTTLWIGTSNWQGGYLDNSRNVELVLKRPDLAQQAAAIHAQLWQSAYAQPLSVLREYPQVRRR